MCHCVSVCMLLIGGQTWHRFQLNPESILCKPKSRTRSELSLPSGWPEEIPGSTDGASNLLPGSKPHYFCLRRIQLHSAPYYMTLFLTLVQIESVP